MTKTKSKTENFLDQERSDYNRRSGTKTVLLVGALIFIVVLLSVTTILLI